MSSSSVDPSRVQSSVGSFLRSVFEQTPHSLNEQITKKRKKEKKKRARHISVSLRRSITQKRTRRSQRHTRAQHRRPLDALFTEKSACETHVSLCFLSFQGLIRSSSLFVRSSFVSPRLVVLGSYLSVFDDGLPLARSSC